MPKGGWRERGLTLRVLILLSLAVLPLGAISVWQTWRIGAQSERQAELGLMLATERAANRAGNVIQRTLGAARGLAVTVLDARDDPARCSRLLGEFGGDFPLYSFAGFIDTDGRMECSSNGEVADFSGMPIFQDAFADPKVTVSANPDPLFSGEPVVIVTSPVRESGDGALAGFLTLSIPREALVPDGAISVVGTPLSVVTFNPRGDIVTSSLPGPEARAFLPGDRPLASIAAPEPEVFTGRDADGTERFYSMVPLVPDVAYALSSWSASNVRQMVAQGTTLTGLLPLLIWATTLLVAFLALDRLVIRHIRVLSRQMRTFARTRRLVGVPLIAGAGRELAEIEGDFREMARSILQDEAQLENNLHEKNILLKEVHHRVKNNLQLVTSIMNMQIRAATLPETRAVLRRLQDRIMSLAAVHRTMYRTEDFNRIDVAPLLRELADQHIASEARTRRIETSQDLESLLLFPDQAVPLSLLASEAITNAVRHSTPGPDGVTRIDLSLVVEDDTLARFTVRSTTGGEAVAGDEGVPDRGLGLQLIRAFEAQLEGKVRVEDGAAWYGIEIAFPVQMSRPKALDY